MKSPRQRRSPEEAKQLILESAQRRLIRHGIRGLTIKDVAQETNINHGTLLHHFGSAEGMRNALLDKMTAELIDDMTELLSSNPSAEDSVVKLFELMNSSGHIKLLAWRAMEDNKQEGKPLREERVHSVETIVNQITEELNDQVKARNIVFLAVSAAIGWGIVGEGFQQMFGISATQQEEFPHWVGEQLQILGSNRSD